MQIYIQLAFCDRCYRKSNKLHAACSGQGEKPPNYAFFSLGVCFCFCKTQETMSVAYSRAVCLLAIVLTAIGLDSHKLILYSALSLYTLRRAPSIRAILFVHWMRSLRVFFRAVPRLSSIFYLDITENISSSFGGGGSAAAFYSCHS